MEAVPWIRRLVAGFSSLPLQFDPKSGDVGFVVGKIGIEQVFFEYFGFPCQFSFHEDLHTHLSSYHRRYLVSMLTASLNNKRKGKKRKGKSR
jgi:hypothetical protein